MPIIGCAVDHRENITDLLRKGGDYFLDNLPDGITLLGFPEDGGDCIEHAIGKIDIKTSMHAYLKAMFGRVPEGRERPDDLAVYTSILDSFTHIGKYCGDGMVESRWGAGGPVLRHPVDYIPKGYGDVVYYIRPPEIIELDPEDKIRKEMQIRVDEESAENFSRNLPEDIELVEPPSKKTDCEMYVTGLEESYGILLFDGCDRVAWDEELPGDIVLYMEDSNGTLTREHAGFYEGDNIVRSKWGRDGPVLRHPLEVVPLSFGSIALFLKKPAKGFQLSPELKKD
jgi:hypothetical protein